MSKPKPGLGKGIVRTFVNTHHTSGLVASTSNLQLGSSSHGYGHVHPHGHSHGYSTTSISTGSGSGSGIGGRGSRSDGFANLGIPTHMAQPTSSVASTSNSTLPPWSLSTHILEDIKTDIVTPFRPIPTLRYSTNSHKHSHSHSHSHTYSHPSTSSTASASASSSSLSPGSHSASKGTRRLSTLPPTSLYNSPLTDIPPSLFSSLPPTTTFPLWYGADKSPLSFTSNSHANPYARIYDTSGPGGPGWTGSSLEIDIYPTPSPSPTPASRTRTYEIHPALSPTPAISSPSDSVVGFTALSIPATSGVNAFDPVPAAESGENTTLPLYSSNLIFHLGASGSEKDRLDFKPRPSRSRTPPHLPRSFPLPEVVPPSASDLHSVSVGEDAYFARMDGMCIADGVGGWARSEKGVADAGRWSRLLTHFCEVEVGDWWAGRPPYLRDEGAGWAKKAWKDGRGKGKAMEKLSDPKDQEEEGKRRPLDPVEIMQRGYEKCLSCFTSDGMHGSSTCLLALLHHTTLTIANVGDCALLLIRDNKVVFRTDEMCHAFNFPLQLGTTSRDEPMKDAKRYDVGVVKGDVVVLGSDGLMDNLFDEDILDTLGQFSPPSHLPPFPTPPSSRPSSTSGLPTFSPQKVSEELCRRARAISEQTTATTPFMVKAIEEGIDFVGGKKDDISVVVGVIGDREAGQSLSGLALHM